MASGIKYNEAELNYLLEEKGYKIHNDKYKNFRQKITLIDKRGFLYKCSLSNIFSNKTPYIVSQSNEYSIYNMNLYSKLNGSKTVVDESRYISQKTKMKCICECGDIYFVDSNHFINRSKVYCNKCSLMQNSKNRMHDIEFIKQEFIKYEYEPCFDEYNGCESKLKCKNKDGYIGFLSYANMKQGNSFSIFSKENSYSIHNIRHYIKINGINVKLLSDEWKSSISNLDFMCACGKTFTTSWASFSGQNTTRCKICSKKESSYVTKIKGMLNKNNIEYTQEYKFENCRSVSILPFDFCIFKDKNIYCLIEIDGQHHFKPCWGGEKALSSQIERDEIKNKFCKENDIMLIRISYLEFKNNTYYKKINKLLNTH
jgi:hypothetical protein